VGSSENLIKRGNPIRPTCFGPQELGIQSSSRKKLKSGWKGDMYHVGTKRRAFLVFPIEERFSRESSFHTSVDKSSRNDFGGVIE
jgi:hypothetical protein